MSRKSYLVVSFVVVIAIAVGIVSYKIFSRNKGYLRVHPTAGEVIEAVYGLGKVKSDHRYEVKVGILARIKKVHVQEGDRVSKGQKLLELDEGISFTSPLDGIVTLVSVYDGETAVAQSVLVRVEDLEDRHIELSLEQEGALRIQKGQVARVSFESLRGEVLLGKVASVFPRNDEFIANIEIRDLKDSVLPGMTADVSIEVGTVKGLVIPIKALRNGVVSVIRNGRQQKIKVDVGLVDGLSAEIKNDSLKLDDEVLLPKE